MNGVWRGRGVLAHQDPGNFPMGPLKLLIRGPYNPYGTTNNCFLNLIFPRPIFASSLPPEGSMALLGDFYDENYKAVSISYMNDTVLGSQKLLE